jgi:uncharacterized membrane protein YbaN (DUF454 family)
MHTTNALKENGQQALDDFTDSAPGREPSVVHSSYGRLRVHMPYWLGTREEEIAAEVMRFAGVTHAEANPLTGNLLILFQPGKTSARALLEALPFLRLPAQPPIRLVEELACEEGDYVTGARRVVYQVLGWGSVGMAVVGAILPGIPTAPFVILAGYFFIRSSPEAHKWLRESRWFGPILRDWEDHRAVRRSVRNAALLLIVVSMAITLWLGLPPLLTVSIVALQVIGLAIVLNLRVVDPKDTEPTADVLQLRAAAN